MDNVMILELIDAHSLMIQMVEENIVATQKATLNLTEELDVIQREKDSLEASLGKIAAKNCSFRHKDFNSFMERVLSQSENEKRELLEESRRIGENLREYLEEQREWTLLLKQQVCKYITGESDWNELDSFINKLKAPYQKGGGKIFQMLYNVQFRLRSYKRKMGEWNAAMCRLIERGDFLGMEDIRQLEAINSRVSREMNRSMRREDVRNILAESKKERLKSRGLSS